MTVELRTLTLADALAVCAGMRDLDRQCVRAVLGDISDEAMAANRWSTNGPAWTLAQDGQAVAIGGLSFINDWTAVPWMFATPMMRGYLWRKLMRHARIVLANAADPLHPQYRHRIEAQVLATWAEAGEFAQRMGLRFEGRRHAVGRCGEDVDVWVLIGPVKG